jgi:IMP dehydrogenase
MFLLLIMVHSNLGNSATEPTRFTFFNQRPLVDPQAFDSNTLRVPQDVGKAEFLNVPLPNWRSLGIDQQQSPQNSDLRAVSIDIVRKAIGQNPHLNPERQEAIIKALQGSTDQDLIAQALPLVTEVLVDSPGNKPLATFTRLMAMGLIQPPVLDLTQYSKAEDGQGLQDAIRLVFRCSGLPRLSTALGLRDMLAHENGTLGAYHPINSQIIAKPGAGSRSSRSCVGLVSRIAWNRNANEALMLKNPLLTANMRCVTDSRSAEYAVAEGVCPVISMDYSEANKQARIAAAEKFKTSAFITVRTNTTEHEVAREILLKGGAVCIEMANANMPKLVHMLRTLKNEFPQSFIMVGNVGSAEGYMLAVEAGADVVKLGRGPGAGCTTPEETGISPGQVTLAYECAMAQAYMLLYRGLDVPMCLDGGISKPGHALLGMILGAETVMMGSFFASLDESPAPTVETTDGIRRLYFGEASELAIALNARTKEELVAALCSRGQGIVGVLSPTGTYQNEVPRFLQGIQGGVADLGVAHVGDVSGSAHPIILRQVGTGAIAETGTRLKNPKILSMSQQPSFDLGAGGLAQFLNQLGISKTEPQISPPARIRIFSPTNTE